MSGHSKWSTIKRQKGANDAKRGALFTKVAREVMVAARTGGGDPDANFRLRLARNRARAVNMPMDNIKRAIERATGAADGEQFEEIVYEGYGPGGVAILVAATPDNRERVRKSLDAGKIGVDSAENTMVAKTTVELDAHRARQNLRLIEMLEDLDDVQRVTANFDIPEAVFSEVAGGSSW